MTSKLKRRLSRLGGAGPGSAGAPRGPSSFGGADSLEESGSEVDRVTPPGWGGKALTPEGESRRERVDRLRGMMASLVARDRNRLRDGERHRASTDLAPLPGELIESPHGPLHVVDQLHEPDHCHGRAPVRAALEVDGAMVAKLALDPSLAGVDFRRALFFDTETTGLAGGTGTVPFLIGAAWFEDESLRVEQLLLRKLGQEGPMLQRFAERLEQCSCLVTYNGKSFDWPLIRNRFVLHRVPMPSPPPHLDLLHCARRVLKRRLESVRLVALERELLGLYREDDVDGSEIPAIYLRFLRDGGAGLLVRVMEHNRSDLVALAALLSRLTAGLEQVGDGGDPRDHLGYAEVAERAGDAERARVFARAAAEGDAEPEHAVRAWMLSARMARKRGDVDDEEGCLARAVEAARAPLDRAVAHLALAKLFEHRRRMWARALEHARHTALAEGEVAHERRIARLSRRIAGSCPDATGPDPSPG